MLVAQHGIENGEEFPHASGERHFLEFASLQHVLVLRLDEWVVARGYEGGHVEHTAHLCPASFGFAVASFPATVIIQRCYAH